MEGMLIRRNALPLLVYGLVAGGLGSLFVYVLYPGLF